MHTNYILAESNGSLLLGFMTNVNCGLSS